MALEKGVNSFADLAEATAYFDDRLDVDAWTSAPEAQKSKALVTATSMLGNLLWTGYVEDPDQPLAFPRVGDYFDPRVGTSLSLSSTAAMRRLLAATFELAYHLLNNDGLLDDSGSIRSLEIGGIDLKGITSPNKLPSVVRDKLKPMLTGGGSNAWWRAN